MNSTREYVPNHLVWAILTTLLCCLPLGIVSIVYAARVDSKVAGGDIVGARRDSELARNWAIASAVSLPLLLMCYVIFVLMLGMGGVMLDVER